MRKTSKVSVLLLASKQTGYQKYCRCPLKIQKGGCFFIACIYDKRMKENGLYKNHDSLNTRRISGK